MANAWALVPEYLRCLQTNLDQVAYTPTEHGFRLLTNVREVDGKVAGVFVAPPHTQVMASFCIPVITADGTAMRDGSKKTLYRATMRQRDANRNIFDFAWAISDNGSQRRLFASRLT